MGRRKPAQEDSLFGDAPLADAPKLGVVRARFEGEERLSFEDILSGCDSLRVLTYSNSLSVIRRAASLVDDVEIIFGREDIVREAEKLYFYQGELVKAVRDEISTADGSKDESEASLSRRIADGSLRLFIVKDLVSHEKLFLMEGGGGRRVLTGSANLSERALGGRQNEGYILFDDPEAWEYYERKYERIKASSALAVPRRALLAETGFIAAKPYITRRTLRNDPLRRSEAPICSRKSRRSHSSWLPSTTVGKYYASHAPGSFVGLSRSSIQYFDDGLAASHDLVALVSRMVCVRGVSGEEAADNVGVVRAPSVYVCHRAPDGGFGVPVYEDGRRGCYRSECEGRLIRLTDDEAR